VEVSAMKLRAAANTHVGQSRKVNEDAVLADPELGLYVVADGMGGHKAGDVASRMVVETMADYWHRVKTKNPPSFLEPMDMDLPENARHLVNSILLANIIIHEAQKKPEYLRMGSTVAAVLQDGETLWSANVGDSRAYLSDQGRLVQVSQEHSMEAEQRAMGLTDTLGEVSPGMKNTLTRVVGQHDRVDVFITPVNPEPGDMILLCSDGLTNFVSEKGIDLVLDDHSTSIERKCEILIEEANRGGGGDNISVILLEVLEETPWNKLKRKWRL